MARSGLAGEAEEKGREGCGAAGERYPGHTGGGEPGRTAGRELRPPPPAPQPACCPLAAALAPCRRWAAGSSPGAARWYRGLRAVVNSGLCRCRGSSRSDHVHRLLQHQSEGACRLPEPAGGAGAGSAAGAAHQCGGLCGSALPKTAGAERG